MYIKTSMVYPLVHSSFKKLLSKDHKMLFFSNAAKFKFGAEYKFNLLVTVFNPCESGLILHATCSLFTEKEKLVRAGFCEENLCFFLNGAASDKINVIYSHC